MGRKTKDETYRATYATREKYLAVLDGLNERYANDEEYREKMKANNKKNYQLMMSSPKLHEKYRDKRREYYREYMREYMRKKREKEGVEVKRRLSKYMQPVTDQKPVPVAVPEKKEMSIQEELRLLSKGIKRCH